MKYKSKIDIWFYAVLIVMLAFTVLTLFSGMQRGIKFISFGIYMAIDCFLIIPLWLNTYYDLKDDSLYIKCGFLSKTIRYEDIKSITQKHSLVASPALSLDKLEIKYLIESDKYGYIMISPVDKKSFMSELKKRTS